MWSAQGRAGADLGSGQQIPSRKLTGKRRADGGDAARRRAHRLSALFVSGLLVTACEKKLDGESTITPSDAGARESDEAAKLAELEALEAPERAAWAKPDEVVEALPIDRDDLHIADIGAGTGYFTRRIAARVPAGRVFAVDVDGSYKYFIESHREEWGTPNIEPRLALYENPLLPKDSLDGVFLSNTYPYIEERVTYFKGVHASLHTGGWLVVIGLDDSADCADFDPCPLDGSSVTAEEVQRELGEAGFALEREVDLLPLQYFLVFRKAPVAAAPSKPDSRSTSVSERAAEAPTDAVGETPDAVDGATATELGTRP